jgi:16S rRNA C1402 (ribose-2'-O) methylase RsmI
MRRSPNGKTSNNTKKEKTMSYQTWHRLVLALNRVSENLGVERVNQLAGEDNEELIKIYETTIMELSNEIIMRLAEAERRQKK